MASILESRGPCVYSLIVAVPEIESIAAAASARGLAVGSVPRSCGKTVEYLKMTNSEVQQLHSWDELGVEITLIGTAA